MKKIRCAIYTRKSTEEGLEQDFNSLDAQREASEAYIKSQQHEGWELNTTRYDDGGYSGGTMQRPALKKLLADIEAGAVDVVVVYKVDRLSRALNDFAKMVEIFDAHSVSFVSVTQSFNTTSSMGRLTLNVLLSFAQFEREVTGERIRDKIAASKKKGMWMGGRPPIGYDVRDRKLHVNEQEAESIRFIYSSYANLTPDQPTYSIVERVRERGITNKCYLTQKGKKVVGGAFTLAQIYKLLRNPIYNGKMKHKKEVFEGEHDAIIEDSLWQAVQTKLNANVMRRSGNQKSDGPAFVGRLYDYSGNKFSPTYSYKYSANGRYKMRYYINRQIRKTGKASCQFRRIRADYLDGVIIEQTSILLQGVRDTLLNNGDAVTTSLLEALEHAIASPVDAVSRIALHPNHMQISIRLALAREEAMTSLLKTICAEHLQFNEVEGGILLIYDIAAHYKKAGGQLHVVSERGEEVFDTDTKSHFPNDKTVEFLAKGFYWRRELESGRVSSIKELACRDHHSFEYVKKALKQSFLSPKIVAYIMSGKTTKQIAVEELVACNAWNWEKQEACLLPAHRA